MSTPFELQGPAGRLAARLHGTGGAPVLVLHPHPLYGGTMATRLVYRICAALADAGMQALRFDFRGAGASEGTFDHGTGEVEDATAAWDRLHEATGHAPAVVGFSFGGAVGARLARARPVARLVMVATPDPVRDSVLAPSADLPSMEAPCHLVWGTKDEHVPLDAVERMKRAQPALDLRVLEDADHFLTPEHHDRAVAAVLSCLG